MPVVIKLKGMPWETTGQHIKEFFRDSNISEHDIHLAPTEDGKACGIGFACFYDDEDARKAMQRNGAYMGKRYVELFLSSKTEMEKALRDGVPSSPKQAGRGGRTEKPSRDRSRSPRDRTDSKFGKKSELMSYSPSFQDRNSSSKGDMRAKPQGSFFKAPRTADSNGRQGEERGRGGGFNRGGFRGRGRGYARGQGSRGNSRGGSRGGMRGGRSFSNNHNQYSSDDRSSRGGQQFKQKRGSSGGHGDFFNSQQSKAEYQSEMPSLSGSAEQTLFIKLSGLPYTAQNTDITTFFKGVNIIAVHIIPNKSGEYAGRSSGSAFIECASQSDCQKALERHGEFLGRRYINVVRCSFEEIVSTLKIDINLLTGQIPMELKSRGLEMPSRNQSASNLLSSSLSGLNGGSGKPDAAAEKTINLVAESANINLGDIKDGCVVGIRNLPTTTTTEEILQFFIDFPVIPDSVRIHYLDANRCSGDAMITIVSNEQARSAIRNLSGKMFGSRKIELFLL